MEREMINESPMPQQSEVVQEESPEPVNPEAVHRYLMDQLDYANTEIRESEIRLHVAQERKRYIMMLLDRWFSSEPEGEGEGGNVTEEASA